jgi:hypothetical protein
MVSLLASAIASTMTVFITKKTERVEEPNSWPSSLVGEWGGPFLFHETQLRKLPPAHDQNRQPYP